MNPQLLFLLKLSTLISSFCQDGTPSASDFPVRLWAHGGILRSSIAGRIPPYLPGHGRLVRKLPESSHGVVANLSHFARCNRTRRFRHQFRDICRGPWHEHSLAAGWRPLSGPWHLGYHEPLWRGCIRPRVPRSTHQREMDGVGEHLHRRPPPPHFRGHGVRSWLPCCAGEARKRPRTIGDAEEKRRTRKV